MNGLVYKSKAFLTRNASTILTCVGGVGTVATAVLAVKATPKALRLLDEAKFEKGEELTKLEVVKTAGPAYIPSVLVGVSTLACIFGANMLNKRQQAALISAYALLDNSYKEYRAKVEALYGEEVDTHIKKEIAKDKFDKEDLEVEEGNALFYDFFTGRYFETTMEKFLQAKYDINRRLSKHGYVCLNTFYDLLEVDPVEGGDEIGWSSDDLMSAYWNEWIDIEQKKVPLEDDLYCYIVDFVTEPTADYLDY